MFQLATNHDLISLKTKHRDKWLQEEDIDLIHLRHLDRMFEFNDSFRWTLKEMGNLFCTDKILQENSHRILELGPGFNLLFHRLYAKEKDYWTIDTQEFYNDNNLFETAINKRPEATHINSLMGEFCEELPNNYFDMIFSISALEHVPENKIEDCYKDMYRVCKDGGTISHSIDVSKKKLPI